MIADIPSLLKAFMLLITSSSDYPDVKTLLKVYCTILLVNFVPIILVDRLYRGRELLTRVFDEARRLTKRAVRSCGVLKDL